MVRQNGRTRNQSWLTGKPGATLSWSQQRQSLLLSCNLTLPCRCILKFWHYFLWCSPWYSSARCTVDSRSCKITRLLESSYTTGILCEQPNNKLMKSRIAMMIQAKKAWISALEVKRWKNLKGSRRLTWNSLRRVTNITWIKNLKNSRGVTLIAYTSLRRTSFTSSQRSFSKLCNPWVSTASLNYPSCLWCSPLPVCSPSGKKHSLLTLSTHCSSFPTVPFRCLSSWPIQFWFTPRHTRHGTLTILN